MEVNINHRGYNFNYYEEGGHNLFALNITNIKTDKTVYSLNNPDEIEELITDGFLDMRRPESFIDWLISMKTIPNIDKKTLGAGGGRKAGGFLIKMLEHGEMLVRYNNPSTFIQKVLKTDENIWDVYDMLNEKQQERYDDGHAILIPDGTTRADNILFYMETQHFKIQSQVKR